MARRGPCRTRNIHAQNRRLSCEGRKNYWIVSCLMTPTSHSTASLPWPPRHPTCPMQLVDWPVLALPTSCVLSHVESRARGKLQHCSAGKHTRQLQSTAPDVPPPHNGMLLTYPVPRYNTVLSHTRRGQKALEAPPHPLTCQKPVLKSSLSKDKVLEDNRTIRPSAFAQLNYFLAAIDKGFNFRGVALLYNAKHS